jgi:hypothetical protein
VDYYARTSIPSLVSSPFQFDADDINLKSDFQRRMVTRDMNKSLWDTVKGDDFDLLLIDLIDERFNLLRSGNSVICKSPELINSGFLNKNNSMFIEIPRLEYKLKMWKKDCNEFIMKLTSLIPANRIVVIKALWAQHFLDEGGSVILFDETTKFDSNRIDLWNETLSTYYDYLVKMLRETNTIAPTTAVASKNHIWGLSPFHYTEDWYKNCRIQIDSIAYKYLDEK